MKEIQLTQNKFALVDDEDFEEINKYKWFAIKNKNTYYAERYNKSETGPKHIKMHRQILNITDSKILGDHINMNGLDNQKSNLRIANKTQNGSNRKSKPGSTSKYLGVSLTTKYWYVNKEKRACTAWRATIRINGIQTHLGHFKEEIEAAKAYNEMAIKIHGEYANLNKFN